MSLIVEDGSGLPNAEAYVSVAGADAYFTSHPNLKWAGNPTMKEQALRLGAQYLDIKYGARWKGRRYLSTQRLDWPRADVDVDGWCLDPAVLPPNLIEANCEAAVRQLAFGDLAPDVTEGAVASTSVTVGPITKSVTYAHSGKPPVVRLRVIDLLLARLTYSGARMDRA